MRKILLTVGLAVLGLTAAAQTSITLAWDYPEPEVVSVPGTPTATGYTTTNAPTEFVLYATSVATTPLAQWDVVAVIPATVTNNGVASIVKQHTVTTQPAGNRFFYLTARNASGESDPSNVALRSGPPKHGQNLKATKSN